MKNLKFRTPVKCQNGHKAFWYWKPNWQLFTLNTIKMPDREICKCSKFGLGEGWFRDGDDQMFIGDFFHAGEIYEGDIFKHPDGTVFVIEWDICFSGFRGSYGKHGNSSVILQIDDKGQAVKIGSTHLTPELIP